MIDFNKKIKKMIFHQALDKVFYLSEFLKIIEHFVEIKFLNQFKEFTFVYKIIDQNTNQEYYKSLLQNKFFQVLSFQKSKGFSEKKNNFDILKKNNEEEKIITKNFFSYKTKDELFLFEKSSIYKKENDREKKDLKTLFSKKEVNYNLKIFFINYEIKKFFKYVKFSLNFLKKKNNNILQNIKYEKNYNFFENITLNKILIGNFNKKIQLINNKIFNETFSLIIKNQLHVINNNKINNVIPFGIISYHFKENNKKLNFKKRKKKKKILLKKEEKYIKRTLN